MLHFHYSFHCSKSNSAFIVCTHQTSTDACYLARHVGLLAGVPIKSTALTVNRLCGSGFQSIINGAHVCKLRQTVYVSVTFTSPYCLSLSLSLSLSLCILQEIKLGEADIVLTGGTESMSQAPYAVRNARWGSPLGVDLKVHVHASCSSHDVIK